MQLALARWTSCVRTTVVALAALGSLGIDSRAQTQTVLFHEDFENGLGAWTANGPWHIESSTTPCGTTAIPFPSGTNAAYFGFSGQCNYDGGFAVIFGELMLANAIPIPASGQRVLLRFSSNIETEPDTCGIYSFDRAAAGARRSNNLPIVVWSNCDGDTLAPTGWHNFTFDVTTLIGDSARPFFYFNTGDEASNDFFGWMIDDVEIILEDFATPCAGDGTSVACPCGNTGAAGHGCGSSVFAGGARLDASGLPDVSSDSIVLHGSDMPNATCIYMQSTLVQPAPLFDGVMCLGGALIRLGAKLNAGGASDYPVAGDPSVSVRGAIPPTATTRHYSIWYRNAAAFCTSDTANFSNAITIVWRP